MQDTSTLQLKIEECHENQEIPLKWPWRGFCSPKNGSPWMYSRGAHFHDSVALWEFKFRGPLDWQPQAIISVLKLTTTRRRQKRMSHFPVASYIALTILFGPSAFRRCAPKSYFFTYFYMYTSFGFNSIPQGELAIAEKLFISGACDTKAPVRIFRNGVQNLWLKLKEKSGLS